MFKNTVRTGLVGYLLPRVQSVPPVEAKSWVISPRLVSSGGWGCEHKQVRGERRVGLSMGTWEDGAFLGRRLLSLQAVVCPLQFSSTNKMSWQIPEIHTFKSSGDREMKGVGVWRVQGQMSCIHAAFVQNFLIEYKNRWWIVWSSSSPRVHWSGLVKTWW